MPPFRFFVHSLFLSMYKKGTMADNVPRFQLHPVPMDGDCFFSSMEYILKCLGRSNDTAKNLRHHVAYSILDRSSEIANRTLQNWLEIASASGLDSEITAQLRHVVFLPDKQYPPSYRSLCQLYQNMMDKNVYWADQYAMTVTEKLLQIRILIINDRNKLRSNCVSHDGEYDYRPDYFCFLRLFGSHYEPVSYLGKTLFSIDEISLFPGKIRKKLLHIFNQDDDDHNA